MADNNNNGSRFSAYWLYAVLLLILLGFNYYSGATFWTQPKEIPQSKFEEYLTNGDVSKIIILNKKEANVYLTPNALKKEEHKEVRKQESAEFIVRPVAYSFTFCLSYRRLDLYNAPYVWRWPRRYF